MQNVSYLVSCSGCDFPRFKCDFQKLIVIASTSQTWISYFQRISKNAITKLCQIQLKDAEATNCSFKLTRVSEVSNAESDKLKLERRCDSTSKITLTLSPKQIQLAISKDAFNNESVTEIRTQISFIKYSNKQLTSRSSSLCSTIDSSTMPDTKLARNCKRRIVLWVHWNSLGKRQKMNGRKTWTNQIDERSGFLVVGAVGDSIGAPEYSPRPVTLVTAFASQQRLLHFGERSERGRERKRKKEWCALKTLLLQLCHLEYAATTIYDPHPVEECFGITLFAHEITTIWKGRSCIHQCYSLSISRNQVMIVMWLGCDHITPLIPIQAVHDYSTYRVPASTLDILHCKVKDRACHLLSIHTFPVLFVLLIYYHVWILIASIFITQTWIFIIDFRQMLILFHSNWLNKKMYKITFFTIFFAFFFIIFIFIINMLEH